ncbi:MAG: arylamine N-acetyltransferase [Candidatus Aegiribacteria sp.]|nr:arylamine N-acetyltransferase [Candidatus Aegiribacteria sp.]
MISVPAGFGRKETAQVYNKQRMQAAAMFFDHFCISPARPDRDSLQMILSCFSHIPWENLTKFLVKAQLFPAENRLRMADTLISEHIEKGTGGTCFSLTEALGAILSFAGFQCQPVMADMNHGKNIHCALSVTAADGLLFLADPGYLVPEPVLMEPGKTTQIETSLQTLVWEPSESADSFDLYSIDGDVRNWRYRIRMDPVSSAEFRNHWQRSFDATGMNSLHLNCRSEEGRLSAHNLNLRRVTSHGNTNEKLKDSYAEKVEEYFGLSREIAGAAEKEWERSCLDR